MCSSSTMAFISGSTGGGEILLILAVILLLFGPKNLPKIARTIGRTLDDLRKASRDVTQEIMGLAEEDKKPAPPAAKPPLQPPAARVAPPATVPKADPDRPA